METFLAKLEERRREMGLSHQAFAGWLDVEPSQWSRARHGHTRISAVVIFAGLRRFPELAFFLPPQGAGADMTRAA